MDSLLDAECHLRIHGQCSFGLPISNMAQMPRIQQREQCQSSGIQSVLEPNVRQP